MDSSPIHTQLLRKSSRRLICSSDEESEPRQTAEVPDTPSDYSQQSSADGGLCQARETTAETAEPQAYPQSGGEEDVHNTIIEQIHLDDRSWHSNSDSETSTPSFKCGRHGDAIATPDLDEMLAYQARQLVVDEGMSFPLPEWIRGRAQQTVYIIADAQVAAWPPRDNICKVEYCEGWPVRQWIDAICTGMIKILTCHVMIIYIEGTQHWQDVPLVKNILLALCKAVRNFSSGSDPRIFIANHLPKVASPLRQVEQTNFVLQQAVRSVGRALSCVFGLSVYEHFTSRRGKLLKPVNKYFDNGQLSYMGCLILRECMLREAGLKKYWF